MLIDIETVGFLADLAKKKFDATFLFMVFDGKFLWVAHHSLQPQALVLVDVITKW